MAAAGAHVPLPAHCAFCYNPTDLRAPPEASTELAAGAAWRASSAPCIGLSGGEPLTHDDLEIIVAEAHTLGFYTNLVTSGVGLNEKRIRP
jgi:pyrroloquinoline quinone biosynthesis protein E